MRNERVYRCVLMGAMLLLASPPAQSHDWHGFTISIDSRYEDCERRMRVRDSHFTAVAQTQEDKVLPNQPLKIRAPRNGGIHVTNWDGNEISIRLCKAVSARTDAEAQKRLAEIKIEAADGLVTVSSPAKDPESDDDWSRGQGGWAAEVLVRVPRGATLDLSAHNGGISLKKLEATITAYARNGGISLNEFKGKANIDVRNGGVSVKKSSGDLELHARNGGLSIHLGDRWEGGKLVAVAHNGGVSLRLPAKFASSLEVSGGRHTQISCRAALCSSATRTWDDDRRMFRLGTAEPVVRISTRNGGIVIKDSEGTARAKKSGDDWDDDEGD